MRTEDVSAAARRHLDKRLMKTASLDSLQCPPRGWVKAIREALGMTTAQLAQRMGVTQPAIVLMEHSEELGRVRLDTLHRAALALDCRLVYALVPNRPLEEMVDSRRREIAGRQLAAVEQSMRLEDQSVEDQEARERQLRDAAARVSPRSLWEDQ